MLDCDYRKNRGEETLCCRTFESASHGHKFPELSAIEKARIKLAALIHDVGKIGVDNKLLKKMKLERWEKEQIDKHASYTKEILQRMFSSLKGVDEKEFQEIIELAAGHHSKPAEAKLGSQIMAILDHFDAVTSPRAYRIDKPALAVERALMQIADDAIKHGKYDSGLVERISDVIRTQANEVNAVVPKIE
ncbi:MAG: HD domain-containing protein [Candidatus Micrarchaeia archaeon]